ncbi:MAG: tRNA epoxyqueuosine(34) reductase QueG [Dehalococcoidia bacterium]|nr:tRNA epoxyqueuosine(34) reductase QueG [Dehalococcoidia bacterium]
MSDLPAFIRDEAHRLGFQAVGFTSAERFTATEDVLLQRIDAGLMAGLPWFTAERARLSCRPDDLLAGARSIVALAASYRTAAPPAPVDSVTRGRVARYAWGQDYHTVLKGRARELAATISERLGRPAAARVFVDTSPLPERAVAQRAGLGWVGKNTNLMVKGLGSWVFLAAIALDVDLPEGEPLATHCGSCDLCIRACPTGAIIDNYTLDNSRCISYLTIEHRGSIPAAMRPLMDDWVFGCDICQDVCPVNCKAAVVGDPAFTAPDACRVTPPLTDLLAMDVETYQTRFRGTAVKRAKRSGLRRNAAIALGNAGDPAAVASLAEALADPDPLVRSHAAWALGRIGGGEARCSLEMAATMEGDLGVAEEIAQALAALADHTASDA